MEKWDTSKATSKVTLVQDTRPLDLHTTQRGLQPYCSICVIPLFDKADLRLVNPPPPLSRLSHQAMHEMFYNTEINAPITGWNVKAVTSLNGTLPRRSITRTCRMIVSDLQSTRVVSALSSNISCFVRSVYLHDAFGPPHLTLRLDFHGAQPCFSPPQSSTSLSANGTLPTLRISAAYLKVPPAYQPVTRD